MFGNFGPMGGLGGRAFEAHYRAMPVAFIDKQQARGMGKRMDLVEGPAEGTQ